MAEDWRRLSRDPWRDRARSWVAARVCRLIGHRWVRKLSGSLCQRCRTFRAR